MKNILRALIICVIFLPYYVGLVAACILILISECVSDSPRYDIFKSWLKIRINIYKSIFGQM